MPGDLVNWMRLLFPPEPQRLDELCWRPAADVYRTPSGWLLKFDLAGVRPEDVRVQINGSQLSVSGIRRDWAVEEGCRSYRMEIAYSHFERTLELPVDLGDARINLECREGMLLVRIAMETRTP